jgi:hypothetical protein
VKLFSNKLIYKATLKALVGKKFEKKSRNLATKLKSGKDDSYT